MGWGRWKAHDGKTVRHLLALHSISPPVCCAWEPPARSLHYKYRDCVAVGSLCVCARPLGVYTVTRVPLCDERDSYKTSNRHTSASRAVSAALSRLARVSVRERGVCCNLSRSPRARESDRTTDRAARARARAAPRGV